MGQAGSGKGTQGEFLAKDLAYDYFSTGHYLRTYLTEERRAEMLKGKLLGDDEMIKIITSYLSSLEDKDRTILDGFPRTIVQAEWLQRLNESGDINIEGVVFLDVSEDKLLNRLLQRGRPDDTVQAIKKRFHEYGELTAPVINFFNDNGVKVYRIDGDKSIEEVHKTIIGEIRAGN